MLMCPGIAAIIDQRDVVVVEQLVSRRAVDPRDFLIKKLDLERFVHVGRVLIPSGALVFLPMEYKSGGIEPLENELFLRVRDMPAPFDTE